MIITAQKLRKTVIGEEFDYQTLMDSVSDYVSPRDHISSLLRQGIIIRVKKGVYVFGENIRKKPVCMELLANLIYGPSYISLDYALQYHGLIPERITTITSVTTGRSRIFDTPLGRFDYRMIPLHSFRTGMNLVELEDGRCFLIAIPEKALADKLICERGVGIRSKLEMQRYLEDNLRIAPSNLANLNSFRLCEIAIQCKMSRVNLLAEIVSQLQKDKK